MEEVANALLTGVRRERWSGAAAETARGLLRELPVRLVDEPRDLDRAWDLARRCAGRAGAVSEVLESGGGRRNQLTSTPR